MPSSLLVLGFGYTAARFVALHGGDFERVAVTGRTPEKIETLRRHGHEALVFAGDASPELLEAASAASHILVSIPPNEMGDPAIAALGDILRESKNLRWIGYLSTTGVYGDCGGDWVDESRPVNPQSARSIHRANAENLWLDLSAPGRSVQVFRLSGIYGPGRNALLDLKAGRQRNIFKAGQVFNRIHVDDIAAIVKAGIEQPEKGPIFNLADSEPAPIGDVVGYAAKLLGMDVPPEVAFEDLVMPEMARSFWLENKRVAADLVKTDLGVTLLYPTYREGLSAVLREDAALKAN